MLVYAMGTAFFASGGFRLKPKNPSHGTGYYCDDEIKKCKIVGNTIDNPITIEE